MSVCVRCNGRGYAASFAPGLTVNCQSCNGTGKVVEPVPFVPLSVAQGLADALKRFAHDSQCSCFCNQEVALPDGREHFEYCDMSRAALAAFLKEGGK